jgi:hypothetical protein
LAAGPALEEPTRGVHERLAQAAVSGALDADAVLLREAADLDDRLHGIRDVSSSRENV